MKIERVVCSNETHEVVLCSADIGELRPQAPVDASNYEWVLGGDGTDLAAVAATTLIDDLSTTCVDLAPWVTKRNRQDKILFRRPGGALPRPESEPTAVDPRDARIAELENTTERGVLERECAELGDRLDAAMQRNTTHERRIAELEAALAAEKARADEAEYSCGHFKYMWEILLEGRDKADAWKTSAQRIANCAASVIEYLQTGDIEEADLPTVAAANAGVELVLKALKEMQS